MKLIHEILDVGLGIYIFFRDMKDSFIESFRNNPFTRAFLIIFGILGVIIALANRIKRRR